MNCRPRPCAECPWVRATPPGQFPAERYDELRETTGRPGAEAPIGAPMFACHKSAEGREMPCAGWLAAVGYESLTVRVLAGRGEIPAEALRPADDWPELYKSYDDLLEVHGGERSSQRRLR